PAGSFGEELSVAPDRLFVETGGAAGASAACNEYPHAGNPRNSAPAMAAPRRGVCRWTGSCTRPSMRGEGANAPAAGLRTKFLIPASLPVDHARNSSVSFQRNPRLL